MSRNVLTTLPDSIKNLPSLEGLWLNLNRISVIPESLANISSLKEVWITYNPLNKKKSKAVMKRLKNNGVNLTIKTEYKE